MSDLSTMYGYIYGNWHTMIAYVYAELAIADRLLEAPSTAEDLALATGSDRAALGRVLACAEGLGFHTSDPATGRTLHLCDLGRLLATNVPGSLRAVARLNGADYRYGPWGRLLDYVRTGKGDLLSPTWERGSLDYLRERPTLLAVFQEAMTSLGKATVHGIDEDRAIATQLDLGGCHRVLDIGGGKGGLCEAIQTAHPGLSVALFDLPEVVAQAGVSDGVRRIAGDFYESVPSGFDVYLLKNVIHNHPRERCLALLANIREALRGAERPEAGRLIIIERLLADPGMAGGSTPLVDLNLHLLVGGSERAAAEYGELLAAAGLEMDGDPRDLAGLERKAIAARLPQA